LNLRFNWDWHTPPLNRAPQGWVTERKEIRTLTYRLTKKAHINT